MVLVVKDRIKDTSSTSGSGTITLDNSPPAGYQAFSTLGNGSTTYYAIQGSDDSFEIGLGTYNANTLTRTTILSSSNNGVIINLPSGSHTVWVDYPAAKAYLSEEGIDKSFTATAGIAAGRPVILNSAGTVTQVAESAAPPISPGLGTVATEIQTRAFNVSNAFGKDGQRVTAYKDTPTSGDPNNYDVKIRVGTVSTVDLKTVVWSGVSTVVQGTPAGLSGIGIIYHEDADKYIVAWRGNSGYLYGCTLTVSGTGATATVSAGTQVALTSNNISGFKSNNMCYDTVNDFAILIYGDSTPKTRSLDISGTNLTAGTVATISTKSTSQTPVCAWNKYHGVVVYAYKDSSEDLYYNLATPNSNGTIPVSSSNEGTVDTVINYNMNSTAMSCDPDSGETVIIAYDGDNKKGQGGSTIWGTSGTRSGFVITWGALTQFSNVIGIDANTYGGTALAPIENGKMIYIMGTQTSSPTLPYRGIYSIITVSGTSLTYGTPTSFTDQYDYGVTYMSLGVQFSKTQAFMAWNDTTLYDLNGITLLQTSQSGTGVSSNLTSSNYLGVASTSASANASVNINIPGSINNDQTGLTIGKNYYTSGAGVISTTLSPNFVGRAISSTQLLLEEKKGNSLDGFSNGSITKGKPVVMQADGDVAQAKETSSSITFAQGSATELEEGWIDQKVITYDVDESKFLVAYRDQDYSSYGFCKVLSVSGTTVTYGSQSSAFNSNSTNVIDSVYDVESGNHVIFYQNSSQYGYAVVASISGTSVTFGTPVAFNSANTHYRGTCFYDSTNKKVVWVGGHFSGSYLLKAVVGTVSGTSISFGSLQDSGVSNTDYYSSAYDTNSSVGVYAYHDSGSDGYMGTLSISGTSITWNTPVNFYGTTNVSQMFDSMTYDSVNKKIVHTFRDMQNGKLMSVVATVSGTSLSLGTVVEAVSYANGGNTAYHSVVGTLQGVVPLVYRDANSPYSLKYLQGTVSGTSISFAGGVTLDSTNIEDTPAIAYDSNNYGIVTSYSDSSTHDLWAVAVTPSGNVISGNLTATNYLGIASNTVANNENATIQTQGAVNPDQSSLTAGQLYYVQTDGTLSTTAGSPSVIAGIATSATTLLITRS